MRLLELFSGTGSIGKIARVKNWDVVSLDLKKADINTNILNWDYTVYPVGYFDVIWASPPCNTFSIMQNSLKPKDKILEDINNIGLPILRKTEEIINYFNPKYWFMENPATGRMKNYIHDKNSYIVDYCQYADWGYRKRTQIWTNLEGFTPKKCDPLTCTSILKINDRMLHKCNLGNFSNKKIIKENGGKGETSLKERYRIPPNLITELFDLIV